jgi:hypothetical protein
VTSTRPVPGGRGSGVLGGAEAQAETATAQATTPKSWSRPGIGLL